MKMLTFILLLSLGIGFVSAAPSIYQNCDVYGTCSKGGGTPPSINYTQAVNGTYVPYFGATSDIDLNSKEIVTTGAITSGSHSPYYDATSNFGTIGYRWQNVYVSNLISDGSYNIRTPAFGSSTFWDFQTAGIKTAYLNSTGNVTAKSYCNSTGICKDLSKWGNDVYIPFTGSPFDVNIGAHTMIANDYVAQGGYVANGDIRIYSDSKLSFGNTGNINNPNILGSTNNLGLFFIGGNAVTGFILNDTKATFNVPVILNSTLCNRTGSCFTLAELNATSPVGANYEFLTNNFNGSGNFTTTNKITAKTLSATTNITMGSMFWLANEDLLLWGANPTLRSSSGYIVTNPLVIKGGSGLADALYFGSGTDSITADGTGMHFASSGFSFNAPLTLNSLVMQRWVTLGDSQEWDCDGTKIGTIGFNYASNYPCFCNGVDFVKSDGMTLCSVNDNRAKFSVINITGTITTANASTYSGQVVCYLAGGKLGHCTSVVGVTGSCTCIVN